MAAAEPFTSATRISHQSRSHSGHGAPLVKPRPLRRPGQTSEQLVSLDKLVSQDKLVSLDKLVSQDKLVNLDKLVSMAKGRGTVGARFNMDCLRGAAAGIGGD